MSNEVEHFLVANNTLGEGPLWSSREQVLYWVDIVSKRFHRYTPATGQKETFEVGTMVGALGLRAKGGLVLATSDGFATWEPAAHKLDFVVNPESGHSDMRFNDGKVDRQGRFWAGSMYMKPEVDKAEGSLYRLDPDWSFHCTETKVAISNGIGWSPDNKTMYYTDSPRKIIYAYDFDPATGAIENRRTFVSTEGEPGVPDGLTVDSEGFIWSARWGGWKVVRYDPTGKVEREIKLPVEQPTCCTFGGSNLDELYITSAQENFTPAKKQQQPFAGDIFRLKTDLKGLPEPDFLG